MKLLVALILIAFMTACVSSQYEDYVPGIVVSSVEYDGEPYSLGCKGKFICEKKTLECVYHYHKEAQNHINKVKHLIELDKENIPIITELYNALCNLYEAKVHLTALKRENKEEWDILEKAGFVGQVTMVATILTIKIRQLEDELRGPFCETSI
tara:strand:+ start:140 stop:601 length:462 start_codon:yes stop_codon:yes gene_type:complete